MKKRELSCVLGRSVLYLIATSSASCPSYLYPCVPAYPSAGPKKRTKKTQIPYPRLVDSVGPFGLLEGSVCRNALIQLEILHVRAAVVVAPFPIALGFATLSPKREKGVASCTIAGLGK